MRGLFWALIGLVAYAYGGYGACVALLSRLAPRPARAGPSTPRVSLIIPCYNEAGYVAAKIENSLALDYPPHLLDIVVITSGSDDGTEQIVERYADRGVRCLVQAKRAGKEAAMQEAARHCASEVLVFTDANALLNREAVRALVRWFADPRVGCVSGEKRVEKNESSSGEGEGLYWRYESALKRFDSLVGSAMGAAGELTAIRSDLMTFNETDNIIEDFMLSMRVVEQGYRTIYEPGAVATEAATTRMEDVFERRARIAAGGFQSVWRLRSLLNPARGLVWWQYVSHRVLRWIVVPFVLPTLVVLNAALARSRPTYRFTLSAQVMFYLAALAGWAMDRGQLRKSAPFYYPFFFCTLNAAALIGFTRVITRRQSVLWKRTRP